MQDLSTILVTSLWSSIIGGLVTYYFSNKNWKKTERQNKGKDIVEVISQCQTLAIKYHTNNERNNELEIQLIIMLEQIENKTDLFFKEYGVADDFWRLKKFITLKNFETSNFVKQNSYGEFITNINAEVYRQMQKYYITK